MSEPFNFNTPITDNTTLVARYRCGDAPYAGKWFRFTMVDGTQYVPDSLENAVSIAGNMQIGPGSRTFSLLNTATGKVETNNPQNILKIEFGGGWGNFNGRFFSFNTDSTTSRTKINLRYITGTPTGLSLTSASHMFALRNDYMFSYINIDLTGLKIIDANMFTAMATDANSTYTIFNWARLNDSNSTVCGVYGLVEPLFSTSLLSIDYTITETFMAGRSANSLCYTKGIGFIGQYAGEWAAKFPTVMSGNFRTTYLG